ncbi:MAG: tail fiber domain-containing protein, partial [Hymenobacter sp.]
GSEPATATTGYGNYLEFDGSGVNTDPIGLVRYNTVLGVNTSNQSELRLVLGDDPAAPGSTTNSADRFVLGTTSVSGVGAIASGTFTPQFYVYSNGAVGIGGDANAAYLLNVTGASHTTTNHIVDGNVGIGTTSPGYRLDVNGTARTVGRATFNDGVAIGSTGQPTMTITSTSAAINGAPANTAGNFYYEAPGLETHVFGGDVVPDADGTRRLGYSSARWSAVYAANGIIQTSDARLKKNVRNLGLGLAAVLKLRPVLYDWKDNSGANKLGFIAQELRQVVPNVVIGDEQKENLGVLYADLVPVLTKAIQEQQAQIEALKAANAKLQAQATGAMKAQAELQDVKASLQS